MIPIKILGLTYEESDVKNLIASVLCGIGALVGFELIQLFSRWIGSKAKNIKKTDFSLKKYKK